MPRTSPRLRLSLLAAACPLLLAPCDDLGPDDPGLPELIVFASAPEDAVDETFREVFVVRPDGSGLVQLTEGAQAYGPAWSPDGRRIAFTTGENDGFNLYVMNADGTDLRAVTDSPGSRRHVTWTRDGRRLAFVASSTFCELFTIELDGSGLTTLLESPEECEWPSWSPDGSRLAFVSRPGPFPGSEPRIFLAAADGSDPVPLASGSGFENQPAWSPDGAILTAVLYEGIALLTTDGDILATFPSPWGRSGPGFSRDGSRIVFYQRDSSPEPAEPPGIYTSDLEGGDLRLVVAFPSHRSGPGPRWRP